MESFTPRVVWEKAFKETGVDAYNDGYESSQQAIFAAMHDKPAWSQIKPWIAHTNFVLTAAMGSIVSRVEGVEFVAIPFRYRLVVSIGEAFDADMVQKEVESLLVDKVDCRLEHFMSAAQHLLKKDFWAIGVSRDGYLTPIGSDDEKLIRDRVAELKKNGGVYMCRKLME